MNGTAAAMRSGKVSAVEIAQTCLARAHDYDAIQPQTWISRFSDDAVLAQAREVDTRVAGGEDLPLAGVPFAIKDNLDAAGLDTTAACPVFAYAPDRDAEVVARLKAAGAIPIGKANLDQFATGLTGTRSPYGAPGCVFDRARIAGGSSSGPAVAVAAGIVAFALGSDTAGSGRVPAAFNGLIGLKPTRGRWSTRGLVPACRSLDCVSVFANTTADAQAVDAVLTAFDHADPYSRPAPSTVAGEVRTLGVPRARDLVWFGDEQSERLFEAAVRALAANGLRLVEVDIAPLIACGRLLYEGPWIAERAAALAPILKANPAAIHPVVRAIVQAGAGLSAVEAFEGLYALEGYKRAADALWAEVDALMLPTAPTIYRIAEVLAEPFALNANLGTYTNFVNLLDMAAVAAPAGFRADGTGSGVSFIGPAWSEARLLALAQRHGGLASAPPPPLDLAPRPQTVRLAVVGAHLAGMPLNWQLAARDARLVGAGRTEPTYRLFAMAGAAPPKPALVHSADGGSAIAVEVYELEMAAFGSFVAEVPPPLAIGTVHLETGEAVKGFVAEPRAIIGAREITAFGGWRAFLEGVTER
ncbi:MAG TPA: allophanate hydrolase [Caulobacteraceae bacterium]